MANFLIDSESQLQAAAGSFTPSVAASNAPLAAIPSAAEVNIDFTTDPNPPSKGNNTIRVRLIGAGNAPVTGATVTITFYLAAMPAMGMAAMNTTATLTEKGNGLYEGNVSLDSGGGWQVTLTVEKNGQAIATKQMRVNVARGM